VSRSRPLSKNKLKLRFDIRTTREIPEASRAPTLMSPAGKRTKLNRMDLADGGIQAVRSIGIVVGGSCFCLSLRSLLTFASSAFSCRYNHDGYGQREDGASYISWGKNDVGLCLRVAGSLRDGRRTTLQHRERDASASGLGTTASGFRTCLVRPRSCTHGVGRLRHSANAPRPRFPLFLRRPNYGRG
jgi:hypothetical protein